MKDLASLYKIESVHPDTKQICDWIENKLKSYGVSYKRVGNNLYSLDKITKPVFSAHLDMVETSGVPDKLFLTDDGIIYGINKEGNQTSLGADDKNGIWLILKMLERGADINFIISDGEEVGCLGITELLSIQEVQDRLTENTSYCIVLDRRGATDILSGGSYDVYCDTLAGCLRNYIRDTANFETVVTTGSISDTKELCRYLESVNMSVDYYKPHTDKEYTNYEDLCGRLELLIDLVDNFKHYPSQPKDYVKEKPVYYNNYNYNKYSSYKGYGKDDDYGFY